MTKSSPGIEGSARAKPARPSPARLQVDRRAGTGRRAGHALEAARIRRGHIPMRLWDVNLWIYAFRSDSLLHERHELDPDDLG